MPLTDESVLSMAIYILTFAFLFALGNRKHPLFYILCGIVGIMFAIDLWYLVSNLILTTILAGVSSIIIVFAFISKPEA